MSKRFLEILRWAVSERESDSIVPPSALTSHLTSFVAAAMAFLAVFALAFAMSAGRVADRWSSELVRTGTIRISAPQGQVEIQTRAALKVLETTSGIASARVIPKDEQAALLLPWLGADLPLEELDLPRLIEVLEDPSGPDAEGLRLRLSAEAPGAVWDDHARWRAPIVNAANGLNRIAWASIFLILASVGAMVTLAANAALNANSDVVKTLRLIGAEDRFIARAFVRRSTIRAFLGALAGAAIAAIPLLLLPNTQSQAALVSSFGLQGWQWLGVLVIPLLIAIVAFLASRISAYRILSRFG